MMMRKIFPILLLSSFSLAGPLWAEYKSQYGQDQFVHETFFPEKQEGVFVEIGAYDGVGLSNCYFFEKDLGWKGICVEPNPEPFEKLKQARSAVCVQACISDKKETVKFVKLPATIEMLSGISTKYDPQHLKRIDKELAKCGGEKLEIEVPTITLNEIAEREGMLHIDFLSIDTEGGEMDILKSIDLKRLDVEVLTVENNYNDPNFRTYLASQGYVLIKRLKCDEIYKKPRIERYSGSQFPSFYYIKQFLPEDPVIVEAVAREGSNTKKLSHYWKKGQVYALESSREAYKALRARMDKFRNVKTYPVALGEKVGAGITTLDKWARQQGLRKIDFLWLEGQGSELSLLKASPEILKTVQVIQTGSAPLDLEMQTWLEGQGFVTVFMTSDDHGNALFVRNPLSASSLLN